MKTQEYSLCFIFNEELNLVLAIQKNRPDWQKGYFNGVGGKFNENETINQCTLREVYEETGLKLDGDKLRYVGYYQHTDWKVYITTISIPHEQFITFTQKTDEKIFILDIPILSEDEYKLLPSAHTAIVASKQKLIDDRMKELIIKYY